MYLGVESITEELVVRVCLSLELLSQFTLVLSVDAICLHIYIIHTSKELFEGY